MLRASRWADLRPAQSEAGCGAVRCCVKSWMQYLGAAVLSPLGCVQVLRELEAADKLMMEGEDFYVTH